MLSFEPYLVPYFVLSGWFRMCYLVQGLDGHRSMLLDELLSTFCCFVVGGFWEPLSGAWLVSEQYFMGALFGGSVQPSVVYKRGEGEPLLPVVLPRRSI